MRWTLIGQSRSIPPKTFIKAAITAIALLQAIRVGLSAYPLLVNKVWVNRHMDAVSRSADASYGRQYLSAIQVLRQEIPPDAKVFLAGTTGLPQYDARDFMQYFLFPREVEVLDCPGDPPLGECILSLAGTRVYFIVDKSREIDSRIRGQMRVTSIGANSDLLGPLSSLD